jgi:aspartyl-tRNA(Asn)/glutamyl-tRNA(Gln) amidotransferase subunit C
MLLSLAEVRHVAALARLALTEDELCAMQDQLSSILEHIAELSRVDTDAIPPTAQVVALTNVFREDQVRPSLPREELLRNAPRQLEGFFEVHAILGGSVSEPER